MPRKEDRRMLLGRGRFTADLNPTTRTPGLQGTGLLHAAFVRSPHAHARINAIDTAAAVKADGVVDVVTAAEMRDIDIIHLQTPSRFSETGAKGMGEGGTIGAPAAVLGAINDAFADLDVSFDHIPVLPQDISAALARAGGAP
jgi:CO/xanthine dehydrogenase Mo-binding subunit